MAKLIVGVNDLATVNPELASEWHPTKNNDLKPTNVTAGSGKKVWWKGKCGHEWQASIVDRNQGRGCPYCSNPPRAILIGFNDLVTTNSELAFEWHPTKNGNLKPEHVTAFSNKKVWWLGKCGHEWRATIANRTLGRTCPYCSNHKVLGGYNDLQTTYPDIAAEWNIEKNGNLKPEHVTVCSNKKVWWKCSKGHVWKALVSDRTSNNSGCPYCAGKKALIGINDLQTVNPVLTSEWHSTKNGKLKPSDVMPNTNKKVWWKGKCGHEWQAGVSDRNKGNGCPICNESHLEKMTRAYLNNQDYLFEEQIKFDDLTGLSGIRQVSYDFGVYKCDKLTILIECQGRQHYEPVDYFGGEEVFIKQQFHDELKREYAEQNGYKLIEIPYTIKSYGEIETFLNEQLIL